MRSPEPLPPYPETLTERLAHWAKTAPERIFLARRDPAGGWRTLSYAATFAAVRAIAAALLERDLSPERPVAILFGNGIDHALIGLGAMYAGVPYASISPPYSLQSSDFAKLRDIIGSLTPGVVYVASGVPFVPAVAAAVPAVSASWSATIRRWAGPRTAVAALFETSTRRCAKDAADAASAPTPSPRVLFTSGSTGTAQGRDQHPAHADDRTRR